MALHAKKLARYATSAVARQLQVCARQKAANDGAPSLGPIRAVNTSFVRCGRGESVAERVLQPDRKPLDQRLKILEETKPGKIEKMRPNFSSPSHVMKQKRFLPQYARAVSNQAARGPLGTNTLITRSFSDFTGKQVRSAKTRYNQSNSVSNEPWKRRMNHEPVGLGLKGPTKVQFHVNANSNAIHARDEKPPKKKGSAKKLTPKEKSLSQPVSKLASDINQWVNEVMDHLAKAERAAAVKNGERSSGTSHQGQRPRKRNINIYTTSKVEEKVPTRPQQPQPDTRIDLQKSKRPQSKTTIDSDAKAPNHVQKKLDLHLAFLNGEMARHVETNSKQRQTLKSSESRREGPDGSEHILEIRPTLVEMADKQEVADTNGSCDNNSPLFFPDNGERSRSSTATTTGRTAAFVAPKFVSGSSRSSNNSSSTKASIDSGKGFILLSNKDKAKETRNITKREKDSLNDANNDKENKATDITKSAQGPTTSSPRSFILVEGEAPEASTIRKNKVLTDNPHRAAVTRQASRKTSSNSVRVSETSETPYSANDRTFKQSVNNSLAWPSVTAQQAGRMWTEQVDQKLEELRVAKQTMMKNMKGSGAGKQVVKATPGRDPGITEKPLIEIVQKKKNQTKEKNKVVIKPTQRETEANSRFKLEPAVKEKLNEVVKAGCLSTSKSAMPDTDAFVRGDKYLRDYLRAIDVAGDRPVQSSREFGPLTLHQHILMNKGSKDKMNLDEKLRQGHPVLVKKHSSPKPVNVVELKPDLRSVTKKEKTGMSSSRQKSEPILFVTPEEILSAKRSRSSVQTGSQWETQGAHLPTDRELWASIEIQNRLSKYLDTTTAKSQRKQQASPDLRDSKTVGVTKTTSVPQALDDDLSNCQHQKLMTSQKLKTQALKSNNQETEMKGFPKTQTIKSGHNENDARCMPITQAVEHGKKEIEARPLPTAQGLKFVKRKEDARGELNTHNNALNCGNKVSEIASAPILDSYHNKNILVSPNMSKNRYTDQTISEDLDPFERWIQTMEESKNVKGGVNMKKSKKKSPKETSKQSTKPSKMATKTLPVDDEKFKDLRDTGKAKIYPRFAPNSSSETVQQMYRDLRATYAIPDPTFRGRDTKTSLANTTYNQPGQIFKKINDSSNSGRSGQVNLITSSRDAPNARLVDPTTMFRSFDGLIAMDVVPVLDQIHHSKNTNERNENVSISGSHLQGDEVRQSLRREREKAAATARQQLAEVYEKKIEHHEKSLEIYRGKLRRMRQIILDTETPRQPSSDNPRRHV